MHRFRKVTLSLLLMTVSSLSFAAGWSANLTVERVTTEGGSDNVIIITNNGPVYAEGCIQNTWIVSSDNDSRLSRIYSTAMAALMSGNSIQLWITDNCGSWSYHETTAITLNK